MSNQPISIKLNVTNIQKERLFKGTKGTYLDAVLIPTPDSKYGEDFVVIQGVSKEEREAGIKGPIIGNAKFIGRKVSAPPHQKSSGVKADDDGSDIPF